MALFGKIFIFCDFETDSFGFSCHDMKMEANEYSLGTNQKKIVLLRPCLGPLYSDYKRKKSNNPAKRPAYYLAFLERDREKIHPNTAFRNAARSSLFSKRDAFPL